MKTVQIYNLHLVTGEVVQAAEDYELKGKKTIVSLFKEQMMRIFFSLPICS